MNTTAGEMADLIASLLAVASRDMELGLGDDDCTRIHKSGFLQKPMSFDGFDLELASGDMFRVAVTRLPGDGLAALFGGRTPDVIPEVAG